MHPDVYKRPILWILIALLGALSFFYRPTPSAQDISHLISKNTVSLTGRVESFSVSRNHTYNSVIEILSVDHHKVKGRVYARFSQKPPSWKDIISFSGQLQTPYGVDLPGQFNWRRHLANQSVFSEVKSDSFQVIKPAWFGWRWVRQLRQSILNTFSAAFPPELAGIAGGILLGERGDISSELYTAFQDSGAIHLLVASGGNVGFVTILTLWLGSFIGLRRRFLLLFTLGTAGFYTLLAGADAPLVRAYLMAVGACCGYFLGRNSGILQGLLLSCLVIVCFRPAAVFDTGFQMSFLATLAIILCLSNYTISPKWPRWIQFFLQIFLATLASQLALLPIFCNVFYKISVTGLLSNMILVPLASVLMTLSFAYYVATLLKMGILFYFPCLWGLELFKEGVEFFADFRFSALPVTAWDAWKVVAYYSLLFLIFHLPQKQFIRKIWKACVSLAVVAGLLGWCFQIQNRGWLISEWNHRAVIVRAERKTFIFNDGISAEKLQRALVSLGLKQPESILSLGPLKESQAGEKAPFIDIWPGDSVCWKNTCLEAQWSLHQTRDGKIWQDVGYSGRKKEEISYCIKIRKKSLCVGSQARFVYLNGQRVIQGKNNQTVSFRW